MTATFGVRSIGTRPSVRNLAVLRQVTEGVINLIRDGAYRKASVEAIKNAGMLVYVPAGQTSENDIDDLFRQLGHTIESFNNMDGEPCYSSISAGNNGRNQDGSSHGGFLVIDVIERLVVDLVNTDGTSRLRTPLVRFRTANEVRF